MRPVPTDDQPLDEPSRPGPQPTLRTTQDLLAAGLVDADAMTALAATEARYAVAISPAMRALIASPDDPIGRQFIPDPAELQTAPFERPDPIGDDALSPVKGIVHRYADRALLKPLLILSLHFSSSDGCGSLNGSRCLDDDIPFINVADC